MTILMKFIHLRNKLDAVAASTWHKVEVKPQRGLTFAEESITDQNLFELDEYGRGVEVFKFDHAEEAANGADFEWLIADDVEG